MKNSTYKTWWREMGAISRGMMFIEGNIATPTGLDHAEQAGQVRVPESRQSPMSDADEPQPRPHRFGQRRYQTPQSQSCATC